MAPQLLHRGSLQSVQHVHFGHHGSQLEPAIGGGATAPWYSIADADANAASTSSRLQCCHRSCAVCMRHGVCPPCVRVGECPRLAALRIIIL